MNTSTHKIIYQNAFNMSEIPNESIQLVITSPPYPMIEMWDEVFSQLNPQIGTELTNKNGTQAFELMHKELDKIWTEIERVIVPGGIVCINIGDAVRTINNVFQLYPSHSRIISAFQKLGFQNLPEILWRKQTNSPNKFMGSGMLPTNAYVTLEHEFILIFRKNRNRVFNSEAEKERRRESAFFWEERNIWFSDVWDFKGISQSMDQSAPREKSAAFPFELPFRIINMYSIKGDTVLDPFLGTGTTTLAAMTSERNSLGFEINGLFKQQIEEKINSFKNKGNQYIEARLANHKKFVEERIESGKELKYMADNINESIMTQQEIKIKIRKIAKIDNIAENEWLVEYSDL